MIYICSECFHEVAQSDTQCKNCGSTSKEEFVPTVYKKTELRCHVCDRVFRGSALINCDNANCPGVIFPTEID